MAERWQKQKWKNGTWQRGKEEGKEAEWGLSGRRGTKENEMGVGKVKARRVTAVTDYLVGAKGQ